MDAQTDNLEAKLDRLQESLNELRVSVARIAATQQEHNAELRRMMNHDERISALEGAVFGVRPQALGGTGPKRPSSARI